MRNCRVQRDYFTLNATISGKGEVGGGKADCGVVIPFAMLTVALLVLIFFWRLGRDIGRWRLERAHRKAARQSTPRD